MNTVIILVENPSRSFLDKEISKFLPSSHKVLRVLDVFGDADNLIEVPLEVWGKVTQKLIEKMGVGIRIKHYFTSERTPLKTSVPKYLHVLTFVRLTACERIFFPDMFTHPPRPCPETLEISYGKEKKKITAELEKSKKINDVAVYDVCYGHGIGVPSGIMIEGLYESIFKLGHTIERLHEVLNHEVKTSSYISMR